MTDNHPNSDDFDKFLVTEYFKHGSIDQVLKAYQYSLPISYAGYHRVLNRFGVIKSAGPNSKLSESLYLLSLIANYKIPLEKVYRKYAPSSIKVSTNTLHRILHLTGLGLTRRLGTALLIESKDNPGMYLTGNDNSISKSVFGDKGDISLPMGHSKTGEDPRQSITRVLQQEVFTDKVLDGNFPFNIVPEHPKPIFYINIADVRVAVYHLMIPEKSTFSSFKLENLKFRSLSALNENRTRPGVTEILSNFESVSLSGTNNESYQFDSNLNTKLLAYVKIGSK